MSMKKKYLRIVLFLTLLSISIHAYAESVLVAVATNFSVPMTAIAKQFERDTGFKAQISSASSGKLFAQINNGAPFDLFLSADTHKPKKLEQLGLAVYHSRFTYALGALVLWSPNNNVADLNGHTLPHHSFDHIAIANPKFAPYGIAAQQVLEKLGIKERINLKLVQGENIGQTYQFVSTGNAKLGFVALSQVISKGKTVQGSVWLIPSDYYQPIKQDAVLLTKGKNNIAARSLFNYLKSDKAIAIIKSYGYQT